MNTILYINSLHTEILFEIFVWNNILKTSLAKNLENATSFPKLLTEIIDQYNVTEIWCITGPWAFTLMRIVTLAINAISYTRHIKIKWCSFFDLIWDGNIGLIEINPREYLIQKNGVLSTIEKWNLEPGIYEGIFSSNFSTDQIKWVEYSDDTDTIFSVFWKKEYTEKLSPLYFKAPHITWSKI